MKVISLEEAKKNLDKILEEIEKGEEIILKFKDKEFLIYPKKERKLGIFKDKIKLESDIDKPIPEEYIKDFYN